MTILVIHHLVAQMLNVVMEFVLVFLNIKVIRTEVADLNAFLTQIVLVIKHVVEINVLIHVLERVDKMQFVMCIIIFQCAVVLQE